MFKRMKLKKFRYFSKEDKAKYYRLFFILSLCLNVMFFGGILNMTVMHFNNNRMPVLGYSYIYYNDGAHSYPKDITEANLYYFSDVFNVGNSIYSLGDFIIYGGRSESVV